MLSSVKRRRPRRVPESSLVTTEDEAVMDPAILQGVLVGFEGRAWTTQEPLDGLLLRIGAWWRHNRASAPQTVDIISERVILVDDLVLVVDDHGNIVTALDLPASPPIAQALGQE